MNGPPPPRHWGIDEALNAATYNTPTSDLRLVGCPHCDLLQRLPALAPGEAARCPRCAKELWRRREDSLERTLALSIAAAILYVVANTVPMLGLSAVGHHASTTLVGGARHLWENGQQIVAVLVLVTAVVAPALQIGLMLAIVLGARRPRPRRWVGTLLRHHPTTATWSMIEVMILGVLVALIKIADYASVIAGLALFALGGLVFLLAAIQTSLRSARGVEPRRVGRRNGACGRGVGRRRGGGAVSATVVTAMPLGWQSCEACGLLSRPAAGAEVGRCPRCDEELAFRKHGEHRAHVGVPDRRRDLLRARQPPARLVTTTAAGSAPDTIMEGVILLWSPTGWPLSLIVLVASIMIPSAKILALGYLLVTVQRRSAANNEQRIRLYRTVELIGRWSMVDVFVDTFTAALVQLQPLMAVEPGPGLFFFAAVVVLTMLAVESFDPRLIWDAANANEVSTCLIPIRRLRLPSRARSEEAAPLVARLDRADRGRRSPARGSPSRASSPRVRRSRSRFRSAEGLEAGKTKIRYNGVDVGTIDEDPALRRPPAGDRDGADGAQDGGLPVADTQLLGRPAAHLRANVSGLGTLISGAYIGMEIGQLAREAAIFVASRRHRS